MEFYEVLSIHEYFLSSQLRSTQQGDEGVLNNVFGDCLRGAYSVIG